MRSPTSGDEDDDQYGSEAQVETQEKMGSELSHKYQGPEWDGKKESYTEWRWEATPYLDSLGLESVRRGRNRSVLTTSASSKEAVTMVIALNKLFRVILRMIKRVGTEAKALRLMIRAEFGEERDGYLLWMYLEQYANDVTQAEVKVLKHKLSLVSFKPAGTPEEWELQMQQMYEMWLRIPEGKRGGTIADLSDMLLDKMPASCVEMRSPTSGDEDDDQ